MPLAPMDIRSITEERLGEWRASLQEDNATPIFMLGIAHGKDQGTVHVYAPHDLTSGQVQDVLKVVGLDLKKKVAWKKLAESAGPEFAPDNTSGES